MLSELEFRTKRHIILDKGVETFVMNRDIRDDRWHICSITRDPGDFSCHIYDMEEAWAFYVNRIRKFITPYNSRRYKGGGRTNWKISHLRRILASLDIQIPRMSAG